MAVFIFVTFVILGLTLIAFWLGLRTANGRKDAASALRELLLARAEGKLTADEFERRQAALYASALDSPSTPASTWHFVLVLISVGMTMGGLYSWVELPKSGLLPPTQTATTPNDEGASRPAGAELQELAQRLHEKLADGTPSMPAPPNGNVMPNRPGGDMREMAKRLADRLEQAPNDGSGWTLLARSYVELQRYNDAAEAFAKAARLLPPDASLLADWADAYVMAHDRKWDKQALDIVNKALSVDPTHLKALALAGSAAFSAGNYKQATAYWTRMKAAAPPGSMEAKEADANLNEIRGRSAGTKAPIAPIESAITK